MKKFLGIAVLIVLIIIIVFVAGGKREDGAEVLADSATITSYRIDGGYTDYAFAEIAFTGKSQSSWYANVYADVNEDQMFDDAEWIVKNQKAIVAPEYSNRFSFTRPRELPEDTVTLFVGLSQEKIASRDDLAEADIRTYAATMETVDIVEQFGLNVPGASEGLKRGVGIVPVAQAQDFNAGIDGAVPDLTGGPMDCFAIATANNLIAMAEKNGKRDELPQDPKDLIDELKQDMQFNNGIINSNFIIGKAAFVARYGLPITTEEIKRPTRADIEDAFTSGDAVEISTTMLRSKSGQANTGHVLTGIGAAQDGDELGIAVHDPATPVGADTFLVDETGGANPYLYINYPLWDGLTIIDAIYIQRWTPEEPATTGTGVAPDTSESQTGTGAEVGQKTVPTLQIGGKHYPVFQFHKAAPDACGAQHWHAAAEVFAIDADAGITDPKPKECGFGKVGEVPEIDAPVTEAQASKFSQLRWSDL